MPAIPRYTTTELGCDSDHGRAILEMGWDKLNQGVWIKFIDSSWYHFPAITKEEYYYLLANRRDPGCYFNHRRATSGFNQYKRASGPTPVLVGRCVMPFYVLQLWNPDTGTWDR